MQRPCGCWPPLTWYTLAVCGSRPYHGVLVMGGDAQLSESGSSITALLTGSQTPIQRLPDLSFAFYGERFPFETLHGSMQMIRISVTHRMSCHSPAALTIQDISRAGIISAPIRQGWTSPFGLWHGPHFSEALPVLGTICGLSPGRTLTW